MRETWFFTVEMTSLSIHAHSFVQSIVIFAGQRVSYRKTLYVYIYMSGCIIALQLSRIERWKKGANHTRVYIQTAFRISRKEQPIDQLINQQIYDTTK